MTVDGSEPPSSLRTVRDALERQATERGDEPFLRYRDREVSFAEVDRRANAVADTLYPRTVEPGDTVCLFMYNSIEYVVLYFALAKIGAVVAPIDTRFTDETLATALARSEADTVFVDGKTIDEYDAVRNRIPSVTSEYFVGDRQTDRVYRDFAVDPAGNPGPPDVSLRETDTLSVTFVQRNAAEPPRGVLLPQYSYINTGWEAGENLFDFSPADRIFTTLPLYSIFTFQIGVMAALLTGAQFVVEDPFDPDVFWDLVEEYDASIMLYLGRLLSVLYSQEPDAAHADNPVDLAIGHGFGFGTDETLIENFEDRFGITVLEGYGVTQTSTIATYNTPGNRKIGSSGTPVSYAQVEIVDERDWPVEPGESGEIVVRPTRPNTMLQRYLDEPEETVEVCRNQWIHSGDIGYKDEDGFLHFIANEDNSIYRGRVAGRVSSLEIEGVINAHPAVQGSAVVGVENQTANEEIKAVVVAVDGVDLDPVDVCQHCQQQLPYLKVPRYVEIREELPRSPTGKIRKKSLRESGLSEAWDKESGYELSR
ncbi:AMP-binding protein [Halobacteriales archaeon Cl-PHB]